MNDLPPDVPRLRAILGFLEQQLAEEETVVTYLRLQRDAVQRALAEAEQRNTPRPPAPAPEQRSEQPYEPPLRMKLMPGTYMVEPKIHPKHPRPPIIHIGGCNRAERRPTECSIREAELGLTQKELIGAVACEHCRPDLSLGLGE